MRVGITAHFQFSVFSGGGASTVLSVAEICKLQGHDVTLINLNGTQDWWDDMQTFKAMYNRVNLTEIKEPFDFILEVANTLPDAETRKRVAKQCIWLIRKPILLQDIESSIFPISMGRRCLEGLSAVWALDEEITGDEIQYLETLAKVPVRTVPYVWTPSLVELYRKEANHPSWIQVAASVTQQLQKTLPWSVHICETNNSASSSCTIPCVTLREVKRQGGFSIEKYKLHNAQPIEKSEFFQQNVYKHCQIEGLSGEMIGRQRIADWVVDPMSCIVAHMRFRKIRPYLLEALWCGIPLIHNSSFIKSFSSEYEGYYYEDNSISGAVNALKKLQEDIATGKGMFSQEAMIKMQQSILQRVSPISQTVQAGWKKAMEDLKCLPTALAPAPAPAPASSVAPVKQEQTDTSVLRLLFTDMWDDFNADYNMFLLLLEEASKGVNPRPRIEGYSEKTLPAGVKPTLILFGPFGESWKKECYAGIPKVHYTGENTKPVVEKDVFLNLGYPHADFVDERYIRLPLWMLEIDWFGADPEKIQNPKPLPLDRCVKVFPEEIGQKNRFCAFVVTNPCNPVRNDAFHWLSQYKRVDSAGRLFNNIGDEIFAGLGGGGGELKKHEFLKKYKFCLSYENASSQGYTTEKLLHAKAAGCIPIYWGDPKVERDFDPKGFIDARKFTTKEDLIAAVQAIDTDPTAYLHMAATPALDAYKRDIVRRTFSQIAYMMLKQGLPQMNIAIDSVPRFLGAKTSEEAKELAALRSNLPRLIEAPVVRKDQKEQTVVLQTKPKDEQRRLSENPVVLTMATLRFLPSLHHLLSGISQQRRVFDQLEVHVWLHSDISDELKENLTASFPIATFHRLSEDKKPEGFADYWDPQHFAWKLWILNHVTESNMFDGRIVIYMDSGIFLSRWPRTWLQIVDEEGVSVLEDPRQCNEQWCHDSFCKALGVSPTEKASHQIWAGCLAFKGGNAKAKALFAEAFQWSTKREVIVGPKWEGVRDGKPYGHRHDQSILSILSQRMGIVRYPMDEIYCDISLRKTFQTGKSLYVHRGAFTLHKPFLQGIDEAFVVNLDKRADRMEKLYTNCPELKGRVNRLSAVNGRELTLTPAIARLFKPHDFFWKKAILGCALSHLSLWWDLVHEKPEINTYLILEDDVKFKPEWEARWKEASGHVPEDADVIYLGGILPPNRAGFETVKEKVNQYFSRVAPNAFFGQNPANRYFHWCNYAYILTRTGAEKVMEIMKERDGYWTSGDHMVCNRVDKLNHYFLDPLVAGCYQDDDPKYQGSAFNDFSRVDGFDSDLWNNDDRFTAAEVAEAMKEMEGKPFEIHTALSDTKKPKTTAGPVPVVAAVAPEVVVGKDSTAKILVQEFLAEKPKVPKRRFVTLDEHKFDGANAYEKEWIQELLGKDTPFRVETISFACDAPSDAPIVIVQRPHMERYTALLQRWNAQSKDFYVFHVSDEHRNDSLEIYNLDHCRGVVRIYQRNDIPVSCKDKVVTVPLGYHWTLALGSDNPMDKTPRLPFRNVLWSFFGTDWQDRKKLLEPLVGIQPHTLKLVDSWDSPQKLVRGQYIASLLDTVFVPCPPGNNLETFRLYEALECGCVPVYVKCPGDELYCEWLQNELGLLPVSSWHEAAALMVHFFKEKELLENYRNSMLIRWKNWKDRLGASLRKQWDV